MSNKRMDVGSDDLTLAARRNRLEAYVRRGDRLGRGRDHWGRMGLVDRDAFDELLLRSSFHVDDIAYMRGPIQGPPVVAFVNDGRWLARCECGGLAVVDPDAEGERDRAFYCHKCNNVANGGVPIGKDMHGGYPRPVIYPAAAELADIERTLLESDDPLWHNWTPYAEDEHDPGASRHNRPPKKAEIRATIARLKAVNAEAGLVARKDIP